MHDKFKPVRKKGAFNRDKTKKWDGKKWVTVNVVHTGQRATLNNKPVVADGKGNWRSPGTRGNSLEGTKPGKAKGRYQSGDSNRKPSTTSKPKPTAKTQPKPTPTRSTPTRSTPTSSTPTRSTPTRSTPARSTSASSSSTRSSSTRSSSSAKSTAAPSAKPSSDMDKNMAIWAKAHPALAKKVKKGQAGYDAIQKALGKGGSSTSSTSSSRTAPSNFGPSSDPNEYARNVEASRRRGTSGVGPLRSGQSYSDDVEKSRRPANRSADWISANYRPGGAGTDARSQVLKGVRQAAKADKSLGQRESLKTTSAKPADKKPAKQKPLTVPLNKIPKDLTGAAGKKYLADLDAGRLTRRRR